MKPSMPSKGTRPPAPKASPPIRYSGIGDTPMRQASLPSTPSPKKTAPSSINEMEESCKCLTPSAAFEDFGGLGQAVGGADGD
ncbi:hypothetical protein GCM10010483_16370 [Actinokineospora diospyrosa]